MPRGGRRGNQAAARRADKRAGSMQEAPSLNDSAVDPLASNLTAPKNSLLYKTKFCKFHVRGVCQRGELCTFAHSDDALQPVPDLSRTKLCPHYGRAGGCPAISECRFAHSRRDLRWRPGPLPQSKLVGVTPEPYMGVECVRRGDVGKETETSETCGLPGMAPVIKSIEAILAGAMFQLEDQGRGKHVECEASDGLDGVGRFAAERGA